MGSQFSVFIRPRVDCPSKHFCRLKPLLDLQVKIRNNKVIYKLDINLQSFPITILDISVLPDRMEINCLVPVCIQIFRHICRSLGWELEADIILDLHNKMRCQGNIPGAG